MNVDNKNIIYTLIPPKNGWQYDRDFYLVDLESLCLSASIFKNNFDYKKIKLYTTNELCEFFDDIDLFDEVIDLELVSDDLKKIDTEKFTINTLYKIFVPPLESEPFIHIDHDFFVNDSNIFEDVETNVFFSFNENPFEHGRLHSFYKFYFDTFKNVIRLIDDEIFENFNPCVAYNCSIFGCDDDSLIKSFTKTKDFFIKHFDKIVGIERIDCFVEQYLQINYLNSESITSFDDFVLRNGKMDSFDINGLVDEENLINLKNYFLSSSMIHISGDRYSTYYRRLISDILSEHNEKLSKKIKEIYKN